MAYGIKSGLKGVTCGYCDRPYNGKDNYCPICGNPLNDKAVVLRNEMDKTIRLQTLNIAAEELTDTESLEKILDMVNEIKNS